MIDLRLQKTDIRSEPLSGLMMIGGKVQHMVSIFMWMIPAQHTGPPHAHHVLLQNPEQE